MHTDTIANNEVFDRTRGWDSTLPLEYATASSGLASYSNGNGSSSMTTRISTLEFDEITDRIIELERKHNISSLEVLRLYVTGRLDHSNDELDDWVDILILYLRSMELRRFSC